MSNDRNRGGRPRTERSTPVTVRLSSQAVELLAGEHNKSALLDALIRGKAMKMRCPHCGGMITVKVEE